MNRTYRELEQLKKSVCDTLEQARTSVCESIAEMQRTLLSEEGREEDNESGLQEYERIYSLGTPPNFFKGTRPTGIIFPDGTRKDATTWKMVFKCVLEYCIQDPDKYHGLMQLRGRIRGRERIFLDSEKGNMRSPVQIAPGLFAETHFDTETMIKTLTTSILKAVHFETWNIFVTIQKN